MRKFEVKNPFYLGNAIQPKGKVVELTDEQVETLKPKDVLGKEVIDTPPNPPAPPVRTTPLTLEEFEALGADEQRVELKRLEIEGDDSNKEKRIALYAAFLNPTPPASLPPSDPKPPVTENNENGGGEGENKTGDPASGGTGGSGDGGKTTTQN